MIALASNRTLELPSHPEASQGRVREAAVVGGSRNRPYKKGSLQGSRPHDQAVERYLGSPPASRWQPYHRPTLPYLQRHPRVVKQAAQ